MDAFGKYTLIKRLGAGGMGEVFLAQTSDTSAPLVVKRVLPHLAENPRFLKLFLDETRIAARLTHPNIVRIHELGEISGTWYVAMEHVTGKDLRELLKRCREQLTEVPVAVALKIGVEIAKGLDHAHNASDAQGRSLKIVHRDVSPHNVLVSTTGDVKLIDFGVAKAANKSVHTATGILKGKFPYMAPEQANARAVDRRTDVFALGIVLWEMIADHFLFRGKNDIQTLKLVRACVVAPPSEYRPGVPAALDKVLLKALKKDPKDRYPTAAAFGEALSHLLAELPTPDLAAWVHELDDVPGFEESVEIFPSDQGTQEEPANAATIGGADEDPQPDVYVPPLSTRAEGGRSNPGIPAKALSETKKILSQLSGRPTNIGAQPTTFVGRVAELADLHQLFRHGARLITLLGPGGTGKTRLSLQFGEQLVSYFRDVGDRGARRGGVWFCDLTEARDLESLCAAVARALGIPLSPGDAVQQLGHAIAARDEVLLVMDNFEQLVALGPDTVERWMRTAPRSRFVVSSREVLRLAGEQTFEVPPLRTPKPGEAVRAAEAVELFIERARAVRPGWEPNAADDAAISEIVRQLDGMPLAIELAAARMSVLNPSQLVQRLPRRFELLVDRRVATDRQATLRGAIDWSWQMLSPAEASTLAQLSVFRGGFSPEAVEAVVDLSHLAEPAHALETMVTLRAKSLVRAYFPRGDEHETRFGLFETIREYAKEKLLAMPAEQQASERHATHFLKLGAQLAVNAEGSVAQLDALDLERDNLSAVFQRAMESSEQGPRALQAVLALDPLLALRGPFALHQLMIEAALERVKDEPRWRALGLEARGRVRQARGRTNEAEKDLLELLALSQSLQDSSLEGRAESYLGLIDRLKGQRADARRRFDRALTLLRRVGDQWMEGRTLSNLAVLLHEMASEPEAMDSYNVALEVHRSVGDRRYEGITLANLGVQQQALGLLKQARANYQAALTIHRELGNRRSEGISHINLGDLSRDLDQPGQALVHYQNALEILREVGARRFQGIALVSLGSLHHERFELEPAATHFLEGIAALKEVRDHRYHGLGLAGLAGVRAMQEKLPEARALIAEATALLTEAGDAGFLDALDLYRAHVELGELLSAELDKDAEALDRRIRKRIEHAERAGPADERHPSGVPSPADRSEHVRGALRALKAALDRLTES